MLASAILVIDDRFPSAAHSEFTYGERHQPTKVPISCVEILGRSVLERTVSRLRQAGIQSIAVISGTSFVSSSPGRDLEIAMAVHPDDRWATAMRKLKEHAAQGVEEIFVIELGAYAECDFAEALQFHRVRQNSMTQLQHTRHALDFWIVNAAPIRASAWALPFSSDKAPRTCMPYPVNCYVNPLADAHDLRRLAIDAFLARCAIKPRGREVKPGIWMDDGARPHRSARIVAPAYLGRFARLGRSAVMARFSNIERNCHVGEGTVIESASILAYTSVGAGLDVSNALVDGNALVDLERDLAVRIEDPGLIRDTTPRPWRVPQFQRERGEPALDRNEQLAPEYGQHLSRAALRLSEVFKGDV